MAATGKTAKSKSTKAKPAKPLYYKIGEACKALGIQPYVLRYWETEFPALSPNKSRSGQRVYSQKELQIIGRIKELLYDEGYTIAGAKKRLEQELEADELDGPADGAASPPRAAAVQGAPVPLDRGTEERIKTLRRGIEAALVETRKILELLESRPQPR
jgi:DNA-binding transcriptional MerR regulator